MRRSSTAITRAGGVLIAFLFVWACEPLDFPLLLDGSDPRAADVPVIVTDVGTASSPVVSRPLVGSFVLERGADSAVPSTLCWIAALSVDEVLDDNDQVIDGGCMSSDTLDPSTVAGVAGSWASQTGNWHIVVSLSTGYAASSKSYSVVAADVNYAPTDLAITQSDYAPGGAFELSFSTRNSGSDDGIDRGKWSAFLSESGSLDASALRIGDGELAALDAASTGSPIIGQYRWPLRHGRYAVLVESQYDTDLDSSDDVAVMSFVEVGRYDEEALEPNDAPNSALQLPASFRSGMSILVRGALADAAPAPVDDPEDWVAFGTGSATTLEIVIRWENTGDLALSVSDGTSMLRTARAENATETILTWPVDAVDSSRYLVVENSATGGQQDLGSYELEITSID